MSTPTTTKPSSTTEPSTPAAPDQSGTAPLAAWLDRARSAGHPVLSVHPGRYRPLPVPTPTPGMVILDRMDIAREHQRARVAWVHAVVPTSADLLTLGEAVRTPVTAPRVRRSLLARLTSRPARSGATGGVTPVGPVAVSDIRDGVVTHVLELPAAWLDRPVTVIRRPAGTAGMPPAAEEASAVVSR